MRRANCTHFQTASCLRPSPPLPITRSGNTLSLNWSAISGRNYEVQYKTDLSQPDWFHLAYVTATSSIATAPDTITNDHQRFCRIVLSPCVSGGANGMQKRRLGMDRVL